MTPFRRISVGSKSLPNRQKSDPTFGPCRGPSPGTEGKTECGSTRVVLVEGTTGSGVSKGTGTGSTLDTEGSVPNKSGDVISRSVSDSEV